MCWKTYFQLCVLLAPATLLAQYSLSGTVTQSDGKPLQGAKVEVQGEGLSARTDEEGAFVFQLPEQGTYELRVAAEGFQEKRERVLVQGDQRVQWTLRRTTYLTDEVMITATRASEQTATTFSELDREEIAERNFGQDFPFILQYMPSTVVTSDAGAGVGYTGIRIRGTDPTRTNVTINGIPYNDAESHGTFWVNLPDFASSVDNVQVQRGVGTSTNGAAAFGASINVQTTTLNYEPYAELNNSYGSFDTRKHSLQLGSGLINDKFSFDARLSTISSDGWVDRARADLNSWFVSGAYYGKKSLLRLNVFSGHEITYQSWWGVPEALAKGDEEGLEAHIARNGYTEAEIANLRNSDRRYNYYTYDKQVDNYQQTHYQLLYSIEPLKALTLNLALHYTQGEGFFEEERLGDAFAAYGLPNLRLGDTTLSSTDLIRRRWLDNDFYGFTYSALYQPHERLQLTLGGGYNRYDGDHFGEIIWARYAQDTDIRERYYESRGLKDDAHVYAKGLVQLGNRLSAYVDLQVRSIDYEYGNMELNGPGTDNDQQAIQGGFDFVFFNPKLGLTYRVNKKQQLYASFAVSNREPVRSDFIDAPEGQVPEPETLYNLEAGYRLRGQNFALTANYYLMSYDNQLVLTGAVNDVGAAIRENVEDSYRTGVELVGQWQLLPEWMLSGNATYSVNRIQRFEEVVLDYADFSTRVNAFEDTDISFSPNWIAGGSLSYRPRENLNINLMGKYVGQQFLDNTSNPDRALDAFFISDLLINWDLRPSWAKRIRLGLKVNNLLDAKYEPNGYTYSYLFAGDLTTENFLYPQAGRNFLASLSLRF